MLEGSTTKQLKQSNTDWLDNQSKSTGNVKETPKISQHFSSGGRFELKYLLTELKAAQVEQYIRSFMRLDKYSKRHRSGYYPIVSLYMDSEDIRLCRETLTGIKNRFKLRIRSYTDDTEYPRFVEIKRRLNSIIIKSRATVPDCDIPALLAGQTVPMRSETISFDTIKQFQLYMNVIHARPMILVRYMRIAYEDDYHNRLRVTFDRELAYNVTKLPQVSFGNTGWQSYLSLSGLVILEIKFTGHYPIWLNRMTKILDIRQVSISKYASSMQESCLLKFCAPELDTNYYG
jgi:hypothetical protein